MAGAATDLREFTRNLPKTELHAHLNGSVSEESIKKLINCKLKQGIGDSALVSGVQTWYASMKQGHNRSLEECFETFKLIHQLCDNTEAAYMVAQDVIAEFAADNVKYLELRSTPRAVPSTGMTKKSYVEAVLKAIKESHDSDLDIIVRFLLAVDRRTSVEEAWDTLRLAEQLQAESDGIVVGMDLSGDPKLGDARDVLPVFKEAMKKGLKTSLHLAEVANMNEETSAILKLPPDRIGHGTFLHPNVGGTDDINQLVLAQKIPLELCLTSNLRCQTVCSFEKHHFFHWYQQNHPVVICTDDKGVFSTSMSKEYQIAAETFGLTPQQLWDLSYNSIDHIFASEDVKERLRLKWQGQRQSLFAVRV